jgi:hypothetical protein
LSKHDKTSEVGMVVMILHLNAKWLLEYLEYHYMIGISHIYLYVHLGWNNTFYDTTIFCLLDHYIIHGNLTMILWPYSKPINYRPDYWSPKAGDQRAAYTDALHRFGYKYDWLIFIDDDEFIVPVGWEKDDIVLFKLLWKYSQYENLLVTSWVYSRFRNEKQSEMLQEIYPELDEKLIGYRKSIIKPENCLHMNNHECNLNTEYQYRETIGGKCKNDDDGCKMINENKLHLAHYYYKKYHPFNKKKKFNNVKKTPIQFFAQKLRLRLNKVKSDINYNQYNFCYDDEMPRNQIKKYGYNYGYNKLKFPDTSYHHRKKSLY